MGTIILLYQAKINEASLINAMSNFDQSQYKRIGLSISKARCSSAVGAMLF